MMLISAFIISIMLYFIIAFISNVMIIIFIIDYFKNKKHKCECKKTYLKE